MKISCAKIWTLLFVRLLVKPKFYHIYYKRMSLFYCTKRVKRHKPFILYQLEKLNHKIKFFLGDWQRWTWQKYAILKTFFATFWWQKPDCECQVLNPSILEKMPYLLSKLCIAFLLTHNSKFGGFLLSTQTMWRKNRKRQTKRIGILNTKMHLKMFIILWHNQKVFHYNQNKKCSTVKQEKLI